MTVLLLLQGTCAFPTNQTIQGWNLTAPELLQLKPAQCIVVCDTDCLRVRRTPFWLHNIYLRFRRTERSDKPSAVLEDTSNEVCGVAAGCWPGVRPSRGPARLCERSKYFCKISVFPLPVPLISKIFFV